MAITWLSGWLRSRSCDEYSQKPAADCQVAGTACAAMGAYGIKCGPTTKGGKMCPDEGRAMCSSALGGRFDCLAAHPVSRQSNFVAARLKGIDNRLRKLGKLGNIT
jgi:hypothetical protein